MKEEPDGLRYKPGQIVPRTGIYRIYHRRHRLMHEATLIEQTCFPRCKNCQNAVRFVLVQPPHSKYVLPFRSTDLLEEWEELSASAV
ncbi:MAG TPA: hypothetical protein VI685_07310 [Candidatus Angelobacter sp.]